MRRVLDGPNLVIGAVLLVIGLVVGLGGWFVTGPGERTVVARAGSILAVAEPGFHFKLPVLDTAHDINVRADSVALKGAEGGTHDQQPVHVDLTVRYQIDPAKVRLIFEQYSKSGDMDPIVGTATAEAFKAVTAQFSATELLTKRQSVSNQVVSTLQEKLARYGLQVISIDMTQFSFEAAYMAAISEKVKQEQMIATQRNVLERIEVEQQQKVKAATADAEALRLSTDAVAYQTERSAAAKAKAIQMEAQALRENANLLELRRVEVEMAKAGRWNGALPQSIYAGAPLPFMQVK